MCDVLCKLRTRCIPSNRDLIDHITYGKSICGRGGFGTVASADQHQQGHQQRERGIRYALSSQLSSMARSQISARLVEMKKCTSRAGEQCRTRDNVQNDGLLSFMGG